MSTPEGQHLEMIAAEADRLDRALAHAFADVSRARFQKLIAEGAVSVEQKTVRDAGHRLKPGDRVTVDIPAASPAEPRAQDIPLVILYEDKHLIVIDKPAGLVVHPGAGNPEGTLVNALIAHCGDSLSGIGGVRRPGIVHRLDKDTSGVLVVAKTDQAHKALSEQFAAHGRDGRLERSYLAFCWGVPERRQGTITAGLARSTANRQKIIVSHHPTAREAITHYEVLEVFGGGVASLIRCVLETGRTHQIRVHMAHIGCPLIADPVYATGFKTKEKLLPEQAKR